MKKSLIIRSVTCALALGLVGGIVLAADEPATTQPAEQRQGEGRPEGEGRPPQGEGQRRPGEGMFLDRFKENVLALELTAEQKTQLEQVFTDADKELTALREQNLEGQDRREKMGQFMRDLNQDVREVLTDDQKKQLEEKQQAARERMQNGGGPGGQGGPGGGGRLNRIQEAIDKLDLSAEQKDQVKTVLEKVKTDMQALRDANDTDRDARREKGRAIMESARDELNKILTEEQKSKLQETLQAEGPGGGQGGGRGGDRPRRGNQGGDRPNGDKPAGDKPAGDKN